MTTVPHIYALTGVRGIAALYVVVYHLREAIAHAIPETVLAVLAKGYLAVDLFFVLSGFVLWMTWGSRFAARGWRLGPDFIRKRLARIWPLHALILFGCIALALAMVATNRPLPEDVVWTELPLHFLLIQNWGFTPELTWNGPAWSISTEFAAYILFVPLAMALRTVSTWRRTNLLIIVPMAVVALTALLAAVFAAAGHDRLGEEITRLGLLRCVIEFVIGVLVCMAWQSARTAATTFAAIAGLIVVVIAATSATPETFVVPLLFAALVPTLATLSTWRGNPLSTPPLIWLGEVSYAVYIAHILLWEVFKLLFVADENAVPLWHLAAFLALLLLASGVLHRLIELPTRRWLSGNPAAA